MQIKLVYLSFIGKNTAVPLVDSKTKIWIRLNENFKA